METHFGLAYVWHQGDWVIRGTALALLGMSIATWVVIVLKALHLRQLRARAQLLESFWHSKDFAEGLNKLGPDGHNPFYLLALQGREATSHILHLDGTPTRQLHDNLDVSDWVTRSLRNALDDSSARLQSGLAILASIGSRPRPTSGCLARCGRSTTPWSASGRAAAPPSTRSPGRSGPRSS